VSRFGDDANVIAKRQGIQMLPFRKARNIDSTTGAGWVAREALEWGADAILVDDTGGFGAGWIDRRSWCEKSKSHGRTVTVKIKWANLVSTRSRSIEAAIESRDVHEVALDLIRSVFPPPRGIRLVGVRLSNFRSQTVGEAAELPFREE
jgi:hypothetical protein